MGSILAQIPGIAAALIGFAVLAMMRNRWSRERPLRLARQWTLVAICLSVTVFAFAMSRPLPWVWLWSFVAMLVGMAVGSFRARAILLSFGESGRVMQRLTPGALWLLVMILCLRPLVRGLLLREVGAGVEHSDLVLLSFALGAVTGTRIELTRRARQLLRQLGPAPQHPAMASGPAPRQEDPKSSHLSTI